MKKYATYLQNPLAILLTSPDFVNIDCIYVFNVLRKEKNMYYQFKSMTVKWIIVCR